eukprot:TRINITY_DN36537_c0_g1_i1.p1 TRINITY_DN36537_c0_g1~~TRINITY_DN36537_c0_g1_i1.p1  ORF type:complete len:258 (-),score=30.04 TRINITY_DN36537_c0_g1_i1:60-833(-)
MMPKIVPLFVILFVNCRADNSAISQLRQAVFFGYDKNVLPLRSNGSDFIPIDVSLALAPKWVDMDSQGILTIIFWLRLKWNDPRLTWDPEDHSDMSTLRITPNELWKPDIALFNKQDLNNGILAADQRSSSVNAHVNSNGDILWIPPVSHKVLCEGLSYDNWPWGVQECSLEFGSWSYNADQYDLDFYEGKDSMDLGEFGKYNQFQILRQSAERVVKTYECCPEPYVNLKFNFSLQRKYVVDPNLGRIDNPEWKLAE